MILLNDEPLTRPVVCSCWGAPKVLVPTTSFSCVVTITFGALIILLLDFTLYVNNIVL